MSKTSDAAAGKIGECMSKVINIGDVSFDARQYAINGTGILGIKKSGKSWLAKGVAEQMLIAGIPIIVFDAIGVWRHLKRAAGPSGRGFPIVVAGGKEPDLPLTPANAKEIVRAAIRENIPLVIDLYDRQLSKSDWRKIVQTCCRTLLYENEGVRHVFLEEAGEYVPQKVMDGETFAEVEKLVRMGGNASLGITLINPRAQEINKAVLELCENLVVMKQRGAHAIDSLEKWMDRLDPGQAKSIAASLPKLTTGECWIFSGEDDGVHRTRSGKLLTFHPDRSKPEGSAEMRAAVVNDSLVSRLKTDLAKVVEEAAANDPKALKARIAELERQIRSGTKAVPDAQRGYSKEHLNQACDRAEREGFDRGYKEGFEVLANNARVALLKMVEANDTVVASMESILAQIRKTPRAPTQNPAAADSNARRIRNPEPVRAAPAAVRGNGVAGGGSLPPGERATLGACIQYPDGLERSQLTVITGYKRSSRDAYIQRLREKGFVRTEGDRVLATDEGIAALPDFEPLPRGQDLIDFWNRKLPEGERKVLAFLIEANGDPVQRDAIDEATGYQRSSRDAYLQRLRAKQLVVDEGRGQVKASPELFA